VEAAARLAASPPARPASSRSYLSIVVANVLTLFNAILIAFATLTLAFGDPRDALFLGIVIANAAIGIGQEVRAKLALDRLSALVAPAASVVRDGERRRVPVEGVVVGDLVLLEPGDQVVADGEIVEADALELDESMLTGESAPVARRAGETVRSGAFVLEGDARLLITAVGEASYAQRLAGQARAFRHPRSPLERGLNRLLVALVAAMVPLAGVIGVSLLARDTPLEEAVPKATAAMISLVPEGLILLAGLTFAVAAARMARRGALAQQLNAIESLASADVICLDKTGTLTDASLRVVETVPAPGVPGEQLETLAARYAASAPAANLTLRALARAWPREAEPLGAHVPFSSRHRYSAGRLAETTVVLGAPELLAAPALAGVAAARAARGRRVIAVAEGATDLAGHDAQAGPPPLRRCLGLVVLAERLRDDARSTVEFLRREEVEVKVLSGDAPATVGAIAADAGIEGRVVDGRELPADAAELRRVLARTAVVGRISPEDKRRVVEALRDEGRYVAMIGDGVNDVPALKAARLAIAQGTGADMARSVADIVLVSGDFSAVPRMVAEGRRILRNVQRVAKLFVTKSAFAAFLIVTIGTTAAAYPFLPRHLTIASSFGVGIPAFFLALAPSSGPWRSDALLREVARFALPAGVAVGAGVLIAYGLALRLPSFGLVEARTVATTALLAGLLTVILALEGTTRRRRRAVGALAAVMAAGYLVVLLTPFLRDFFALAAPAAPLLAAAAGGAVETAAVTLAGLRLSGAVGRRTPGPSRRPRAPGRGPSAPG
jgi:P-type E1-E2 ATPase